MKIETLLFFLSLEMSSLGQNTNECTNDWKYFNEKCWYFSEQSSSNGLQFEEGTTTWYGVEKICRAFRASLATLTSIEERVSLANNCTVFAMIQRLWRKIIAKKDWIYDNIISKQKNRLWWIGLKDVSNLNTTNFKWIDNIPFRENLAKWDIDQLRNYTSNKHGMTCGAVAINGAGLWEVHDCYSHDASREFICVGDHRCEVLPCLECVKLPFSKDKISIKPNVEFEVCAKLDSPGFNEEDFGCQQITNGESSCFSIYPPDSRIPVISENTSLEIIRDSVLFESKLQNEIPNALLSAPLNTYINISGEDVILQALAIAPPNQRKKFKFELPNGNIYLQVPYLLTTESKLFLQAATYNLPNVTIYEKDINEETFQTKHNFLPPNFLILFGLFAESREELNLSVTWDSKVIFDGVNNSAFIPASTLENVLITSLELQCSFVDVDSLSFSYTGCERNAFNNNDGISCSCNHTTTFATLLSVTTVTIPRTVKEVSYVMQSLSVVFLCIAIIVLLAVRKKISNSRTAIQINLAAALLLFHLFYLFHDSALNNEHACVALTIITHFLLLASGTWMVIEGIELSMKTSKSALEYSGSKRKSLMRIGNYVFGWGVPALIVIIASIVGVVNESYIDLNETYNSIDINTAPSISLVKKYNQCWLSSKSGMRVSAVIIPLAVVVLINICIVGRVAVFVATMKMKLLKMEPRQKDKLASHLEAIKDGLRAVIMLFPVLGVPWILAFFVGLGSYEVSLGLLYLHSVVNGLQGVFLFIVYCIVGSEVRNAVLSAYRK